MDHVQTERLREQIRREERTLEAWTMKYLNEADRTRFAKEAAEHEGQYPPKHIWKGAPVLQPLEPTPGELLEEECKARSVVESNRARSFRQAPSSITAKALDIGETTPTGYMRSSRLTHDTRTEALLNDLSPALVCPGAVYVRQRYISATGDAFKYNSDKLDPDNFQAREEFALRRTWAQQHAEKCLLLGEKPFLSGGLKAEKH